MYKEDHRPSPPGTNFWAHEREKDDRESVTEDLPWLSHVCPAQLHSMLEQMELLTKGE